MGIIEQEVKELRQLRRDIKAGKVSPESAALEISIYSQTEKRLKLSVDITRMMETFGKRPVNRLIGSNIIGEGVAFDDMDVSEEQVKCRDTGKLITRVECVDRSGDNESCNTCEHHKTSESLVLDT